MGVSRRPGLEAKEERLCRRAEIELGLAVPGGEVVVKRAAEAMALADEDVAPDIDWRVAMSRIDPRV